MQDKLLKQYTWPVLSCLFVLTIINFIIYEYLQTSFKNSKLTQSSIEAQKLQSFFSKNNTLITLKSQSLTNPLLKHSLEKLLIDDESLLTDLEKLRNLLQASIVYVMNHKGEVIASTRYEQNKSLTGNNYAFRDYFINAIQGNSVVIPALGVTTKQRGIYYATPIFQKGQENSKILGVLVVKMGLDELDHFTQTDNLKNYKLIFTPDYYLFSGGKSKWLYHRAFNKKNITPEELVRYKNQYGLLKKDNISFLPIDLTQTWVELEKISYINFTTDLKLEDSQGVWRLSCLYAWTPDNYLAVQLISSILTFIISVSFGGWFLSHKKKQHAMDEKNKANEIFAKIVSDAPFGIMIMSKEKKVLDANPEALRIMGRHDLEEIRGKVCHEYICSSEVDRCPVLDLKQTLNRSERKILNVNGIEVDILKTCIPIIYKGEKCLLETFVDISEQKKAQAEKEAAFGQVLHSSKLAALGNFTTGITHEINNPLTIALGYFKILKINLSKENFISKEQYSQMEAIDTSLIRISKIIENLQTFTNENTDKISNISLSDILNKTIKALFPPEAPRKYKMTILNNASFDIVLGSFSSISQIYLQLLNNAIDAVNNQDNGEIKIEIRNDKGKVYVDFINNGFSIPPETQSKIFDLFFTTYSDGKHAGLGLVICQSLAASMNGNIVYADFIPQGSKFTLALPLSNSKEINL